MRAGVFGLSICLAALGGCDGGDDDASEGPTGPSCCDDPPWVFTHDAGPITLIVTPGDERSAIGTPPVVTAAGSNEDATNALSRFSSWLELRTWPELGAVPATFTLVVGDAGRPRLEVRSTSPLEDRWYALRTFDLPNGMTSTSFVSVEGGNMVVRFRTGSAPQVLEACWHRAPDATSSDVLHLSFSEGVKEDSPEIVRYADDSTMLSCESSAPDAAITTVDSLSLTCGHLDTSRSIEVDLSGLSGGGHPVTPATVTLTAFGGCVHPPLGG
jgi:hypothetical protein